MTIKSKTTFYGSSNVGRVRTNNEDAFIAQSLWDGTCVLAVAIDGVGGYEGGEIAADIARKTIPEYLSASPNGERVELLKHAVTAANNAIFEARETDPEHGQMSCVLTAAIIDMTQKQVSMVHVGDSRLYGFRHGKLKKLSHDHSLVGYREEIGDLTEEEAMNHPKRNEITREVGSEMHKPDDDEFIEAQVFPLLPDTTLLLCSDGLTDMITSATITDILNQDTDLKEKTDALIEAALVAGGKDNVTVVLVEYQSDEPGPSTSSNNTDDFGLPISIEAEIPETPKTPSTEKGGKKRTGTIIGIIAIVLSLLAIILWLFAKPTKPLPQTQPNQPTQIGMPATGSTSITPTPAVDSTPLTPTNSQTMESLQMKIDSLTQKIAVLDREIDSINTQVIPAYQQWQETLKLELTAILQQLQ